MSRIGLALASTIVAATVTGAGMTAATLLLSDAEALSAAQIASFPEVNRDSKQDRLNAGQTASSELGTYQLASAAPSEVVAAPSSILDAAKPVIAASVPVVAAAVEPTAKPKPPVPKLPSAAMLRDNQIASIKERLKLSADQERHWPAVEAALRGVLRQAYEAKRRGDGAIDPNSPEVQRLKSAAMPLLMQLREDQKREVRQLASVIGLADVASMI